MPPPRLLVADAHNDLLLELVHRRSERNPFATYWLPHFRAGAVSVQIAAVYSAVEYLPEAALRRALEQVHAMRRLVAENDEDTTLVTASAQLDTHGSAIRFVLSMEGAEPFAYDCTLADTFWHLGVRVFALTWNRRNAFADGSGEPEQGGLSRLGGELVDRLVSLGAILDLAHSSRRTFDDVLAQAGPAEVMVSHTGCRAIVDTPRNIDDNQLRAIAERHGVVGIMAHPVAIDPTHPTLERVCDHILHALEIAGPSHVCVGADFIRQVALSGALPALPGALLPNGVQLADPIIGYEGPGDYGRLAAQLRARGVDDETIHRVLFKNLVDFLRRGLPQHCQAT